MGKKKHEKNCHHTRFELEAPGARQVFVAGTFNGWKPDAELMARDDAGRWVADLELGQGRHEYKFIVDGAWCCSVGPDGPTEQVDGGVPNEHGTMNRVVEVRE